MKALENGLLDSLIIFEDIEVTRFVTKNPITDDIKVLNYTKA
jgi:hypothetical protein